MSDRGTVLVVDDEAVMREILEALLIGEGYKVRLAENGEAGLLVARNEPIDLAVLDVMLPDLSGIEVLDELKKSDPEMVVVMITAFASVETAITAMKRGAFDYIAKPFKNDEVLVVISNGLKQRRLVTENRTLRQALSERERFDVLVGKSPRMQEVYSLIKQVGPSRSTVLISGESGTGKELVAKAIHSNSVRRDKSFVTVNSGSLPTDLLESNLFGHLKGAFTGAINPKKGLFEIADGGSIFFDEVGTIHLDTQAKLLRVIQEKEFMRLGGVDTLKVDVRIIAATNCDLERAVVEGQFREDLYYRLNVINIQLPPLRQRKEDILLLVNHFLDKYGAENDRVDLNLTGDAFGTLLEYDWPGNVRELENVIERATVLAENSTIDKKLIPDHVRSGSSFRIPQVVVPAEGISFREVITDFEKRLIESSLETSGGVQKSEHRKGIEEEVVYIITDSEKDVFLSIETLEERDRLIEAFWRKRDPNPATPQNEFRIEHYERIEYANKFLGRETFRPGWSTDRGRMRIILGEPREVQRFDGYNNLVAAELWFYEGDVRKALPSFFYLLFFKRHGIGEYQLYHPLVDGPGALLQGQFGNTSDNLAALEALREISPELATASLSFDTSEPPDRYGGRASMGTDIMLAKIEESPKRAIRTDYADAWLRYGKRVSAEYSFNYVPSRSVFSELAGPEATPFLNYSIEIDPQNFTMETDEDRTSYYTTLDVNMEVRDEAGNLVVIKDQDVYVKLTPSQVQKVAHSPFAFQDNFPLLPGDYKVSVILRNRVVRQYTVAEWDVHVEPISEGRPGLSDIVMGFRTELKNDGTRPDELRTFQVGNFRIHPSAGNVFPLGETVHVFFQVIGTGPEYGLQFALLDGDKTMEERVTQVEDYQGGPVIERFLLANMVGGNYELRVRLIDPGGTVVVEKTTPIQVSPRSAIARPWNIRRSFNTRNPGVLALARGAQLTRLKRYAEAESELEKAVAADNPRLVPARWKLAGAYILSRKSEQALQLLVPLEEEYPNQYEVIAGLGFAYFLEKDSTRAVDYLERAIKIRHPDTSVLNALGESYQQTGSLEKAREAFERSLELNPDQKAVHEILSSLGESK